MLVMAWLKAWLEFLLKTMLLKFVRAVSLTCMVIGRPPFS